MRQAVVRRELDPLEVDQDQPDLVGPGAHQQARDQGVDAHALARAGGAGDQQVRHLRQVDRVGLARHVAAERERQRARRPRASALSSTSGRKPTISLIVVRDLDADDVLARDRRLDPDRAGRQGHRQVVGEGLDARQLDVVLGLDLVLGHDRPGVGGHDLGRDREAEELLLDAPHVRRVVDAGADARRRRAARAARSAAGSSRSR